MSRGAAAAAALAAALGGCATAVGEALPSLESVVRFDDPASCAFAAPLERLFEGLTVWDERTARARAGPPMRVAGLARPVVPRLAEAPDGYLSASAALRGRWYGLTVTAIETVFRPESDVGWHEIHFAEPPEQALPLLNAQGFGLDSAGRAEREAGTAEWQVQVSLSLDRRGRGSALSCAAGY